MKQPPGILTFIATLWLASMAHAQPTITTQPVSMTNAVADTVQFSVNSPDASGFHWLRGGVNLTNGHPAGRAAISGATTATLTLGNITTNDQANYSCRVTNNSGSVTSNIASLTVIVSPGILKQPVSYNTNVGATVRFSVVASGTPPLAYQWRMNGADVSGKTLASYTLNNVSITDSGLYSVRVSNAAGSAASSNAVLNVGIPPIITDQPSNLVRTQGQSASFTVTATGPELEFFWKKAGAFIAGATNSVLTFNSVVPTNAGVYTCLVSNFAESVLSMPARLTVDYPPMITVPPVGQTVGVGSNFNVSVTASGVPALAYQWRIDGAEIAGATVTRYSVIAAQTAHTGDYDVIITNSLGSITSAVAHISVVYYGPAIGMQPISRNVPVGDAFTLSATATGTAPLYWQWRYNRTPIPGANTNSYALTAAQLADAGSYDVVVTNVAGSITSSVAVVNVGYVPVIVEQPQSLTNSVGGTAHFSCTVTGTMPVDRQWTLNGYIIAGETNVSLTLTNLQPNSIGYYALAATNIFGATVSSDAALNLIGYNFSQWAGLVAYYPLDGNANDFSGNANHGTNFGAVSASDRFGNPNGALRFNGIGNYIRCKTGAYFGSKYSVCAWVNATAYNNFSRLLDFGNGAAVNNTDLALSGGTTGKPYFEVYIGNRQVGDCSSPTVIPLNTWVYVAGTCDGTQISLYFNGSKQNQVNVRLNRQFVTTMFNYIGRSNWSADSYFAGRFDDIRILNRALSSDEVAQLYVLESQPPLTLDQNLLGILVGGSNFSLDLSGQPGAAYALQISTSLAPPIQWQSIFTNTADTNGLWQFVDTNLNSPQKFYRVTRP